MILTSQISSQFANTGKTINLHAFINDYRLAVGFYVDYLWNNRIEVGKYVLDISKQKFQVPTFFPNNVKPDTELSARALKCAATQAMGMVSSRLKKLQKTQYIIKKKQKSGENIAYLQSKYDKLIYKLRKPKTNQIFPELNSICCQFIDKKTALFDGIVILSSLGKAYGKIIIPIKLTRHYNQLKSIGMLKKSFLIYWNKIDFRFDIRVEKKKKGDTEGADQGVSSCITLSDGQVTGKDIHGHDLSSINKKLSRKKKGSKSFRKAQAHRTNYINWSIKQLNLDSIKQINFEKIKHMRKGKKSSRFLSHFAYTQIESAMNKHCYLNGVRFKEQSNAYRSQRCNECGFTHYLNHKGKLFTCRNCSLVIDADLNAALNHKENLCGLVRDRQLPNRTNGFFWNKKDVFDAVTGEVFTVPLVNKTKV